jgi:hypothetical protein
MKRLFSAMLLLACSGAQAAEPLDGFLQGFDRGCSVGPAFQSFSKSLNAKFNEGGDLSLGLVAPDAIAARIGPAMREKKADHVLVDVPLAGEWRGLKVKGLQFAFGIENGINVYAIVFDETEAVVQKTFDRAIIAGNKKMKGDTDASTGVSANDGTVTLYCDWST